VPWKSRLAEQEKVAKTFSGPYAERQELFLNGILELRVLLLTGAQRMLAKGKLIERVIRRVSRDAGEPVQSEERFSMSEQLDKLFALDKLLRAEVKGAVGTAGSESDGGGEDTWVTERLAQIARQKTSDDGSIDPPQPAAIPRRRRREVQRILRPDWVWQVSGDGLRDNHVFAG